MRAFLGVALLLAVSASAFRTDYNMSEEEFEAEFGGKTDDADLEQRKADTLAKAEAEINQHNVQFEHGETEWFEEINGDSDKPLDIFIDSKTGVINVNGGRSFGAFDRALDDPLRVDAASEARIKALLDRAATPTSYDARTYGLISPVKNQQQCGSCCAFSTTAAIETSFYKTNGGAKGHVDVAEETLIDCGYSPSKGVNACNGSIPDGYLSAAPGISGGQYPHEYSDPYLNTSPYMKCRNITPLQWGAKVTDKTYTYSCNDTKMQAMISQYGAVVTTIDATLLQNYGGGIMNTQCSNPKMNHAVTAVGYGVDTDGKPYYIVKNSWGPNWGESGFFRIKTGICAFGGFCGVPLSTATGTYGTVPPMPAKATCDISKSVGTSTLTGTYNIQINGFKSTAKCTNSVCTPTTAQTNACYYMCGNILSC